MAPHDFKDTVELHEQARRELARHDASLEDDLALVEHISEYTKIILAHFTAAHEYSMRIEAKLVELEGRVANIERLIDAQNHPHI